LPAIIFSLGIPLTHHSLLLLTALSKLAVKQAPTSGRHP
jgi:hypothetical protein